MQVGLNIEDWLKEATTDNFTQKLARGVKSHQITMPVYVYTPLVYVQSKEKYFGTLYRSQDLKFAAETALNKLGFSPTGKKDEAELFMQIEANTEKGRTQTGQKMFTALLISYLFHSFFKRFLELFVVVLGFNFFIFR